MNEELQERYIYAVVRRLPRKQREDIEQELRGLIADMLEARCRGLPPTEHDLRVVLAELGTPRELYRKYSPDAGRSLIGPAYYARYRQVLRVVLGCTALGLTFALLLVQVGEGFVQPWYALLGGWLAALWQGEAVAFAVVTAVFALLERKGVRVEGDEGLDSLPPVPKKRGAIPWGEPVADIVFAVLLAAFLLSAPDWLCCIWVEGQPLPVLDAAVVRGRWGLVVGISVAGVAGGCLKLLEGRRTRRLAWALAGCGLVAAGLSCALLWDGQIWNQALLARLAALAQAEGTALAWPLQRAHTALLCLVLIFQAADMGVELYQGYAFDR